MKDQIEKVRKYLEAGALVPVNVETTSLLLSALSSVIKHLDTLAQSVDSQKRNPTSRRSWRWL